MKLMVIFFALITAGSIAQAASSGRYRVVSANHGVGGGATRCVAFTGSNVFGAVGDVLSVSLDNSGLQISETTSFPQAVSLPFGAVDVPPTGCCGGDHIVYEGQRTTSGGNFAIINLSASGRTQFIEADNSQPDKILITDSFPQSPLSTCHLEKAN